MAWDESKKAVNEFDLIRSLELAIQPIMPGIKRPFAPKTEPSCIIPKAFCYTLSKDRGAAWCSTEAYAIATILQHHWL